MQHHDVEALIQRMAADLRKHIETDALRDPLMVGIHTGGVWVAERLHAALKLSEPLGKLNIAFYRDDFTHIGLHPQVSPSSLPFDVEGRDVILVDDVLQTGRTIRAALNELFDFGRPAHVVLAVLCDRPGRELPIQADVVGETFMLDRHEQIVLNGPAPLNLTIEQKASEE
ncbi:MAG: bifunctional pyr operon transcriptional regulator/uracil phosphoribosyltransferase PyrR [Halothiobacillaceae bacterium]|nr:MAG: bifunctional pyr operon transcriptional regulator/uracil phosphoribosyltransferase PyrR [Halothiobacillaceae bacterium]